MSITDHVAADNVGAERRLPCNWTSYRFFLELFRSPIGDPNLTSALVRDLPVPTVIALKGSGDLVGD
jgi:hypothetical protein